MYIAHRNKPFNDLKKEMNSIIATMRGVVERAFATLKRGYGFYRTKYLNLSAYNLKKATTFA